MLPLKYAVILGMVVATSTWAEPTHAQLNTTLQLPTFGFTTVATTVSVPDRGSTQLGGISRYRAGRNQAGTPLVGKLPFIGRPFNSVGIGSEHEFSNMSVSAYIHDFDAMEETLMAQAAANRARGLVSNGPARPPRVLLGENPAAPSIVDIRNQQLASRQRQLQAEDARQVELRDLWYRAVRAEQRDKPHVARIFYRMISRDATGRVRDAALAKLAALDAAKPSGALAAN